MKEGSGYGEKLISDQRRRDYNESDEGGNAPTLQKKPQLLFKVFFSMPIGSASKNQVGIWQFLATIKTADLLPISSFFEKIYNHPTLLRIS